MAIKDMFPSDINLVDDGIWVFGRVVGEGDGLGVKPFGYSAAESVFEFLGGMKSIHPISELTNVGPTQFETRGVATLYHVYACFLKLAQRASVVALMAVLVQNSVHG